MVRIPKTARPSLRDILIFASVVVAVAAPVAVFALHLQPSIAEQAASRLGESEGLPDVMGSRCSEQTPKRL